MLKQDKLILMMLNIQIKGQMIATNNFYISLKYKTKKLHNKNNNLSE